MSDRGTQSRSARLFWEHGRKADDQALTSSYERIDGHPLRAVSSRQQSKTLSVRGPAGLAGMFSACRARQDMQEPVFMSGCGSSGPPSGRMHPGRDPHNIYFKLAPLSYPEISIAGVIKP